MVRLDTGQTRRNYGEKLGGRVNILHTKSVSTNSSHQALQRNEAQGIQNWTAHRYAILESWYADELCFVTSQSSSVTFCLEFLNFRGKPCSKGKSQYFFRFYIVHCSPKAKWILMNNPRMNSTLFTDPETNNYFSIIAQVLLNSVVNLFCGWNHCVIVLITGTYFILIPSELNRFII